MTVSRRSFTLSLLGCTALVTMGAAKPALRMRRRPNVITIILDDVGYSDLGCFGAEIHTPNMDALAGAGLRYVHFDTKAVCASTRASLMTGRNSQSVNMPDVPDVAPAMPKGSLPPDAFQIPQNAQNIAQLLGKNGYATWAVGKWHLIPMGGLGPDAPRDSWPLQRGFDYFYGFARGWTDQYKPELVEGNGYIKPALPADYHLSVDLVDKAVSLIDQHVSSSSTKPFYLNLAFGAAHAPLQVPPQYSRKYDAVYAAGWDAIRDGRFERMKRLGIIPESTVLPPRNPNDRAWEALSEDEKIVFARFMAVYAGFIEHADEQIGRVLAALRKHGLEEDTLVILMSDNGAASEAGQAGEFDGLYRANKLTAAQERARLDDLGSAKTEASYPRPWAMASVTPLRRYKLWPYSGGTRTPLIIRWPRAISDKGALRRQFVDVVDIAPTIAEAVGTRFDATVNGVAQMPVAGRSFKATFSSVSAPGRQTQYFELRGNRAITDGKWRAVALHECGRPYDNDRWELYDLSMDFSESHDVASQFPAKVEQMKLLWTQEWTRFNKAPLAEPAAIICTIGKMYDQPFKGLDQGG
jgi:arylsulfatase